MFNGNGSYAQSSRNACTTSNGQAALTRRNTQEENLKKIERLGILLENIRQTAPENRIPLIKEFEIRYNDLVFLRDSYARFNELSQDERGRIDLSMIKIAGYKKDWNDKKSNTVWE
jgi:hypothetical protein